MPQIIPPVPFDANVTDGSWNQFHEILRKTVNQPPFYVQTTDPGTAGVPNGTWAIWKNTTSGIVKLWVNDGGVMRSVTIT